MLTKFMYLKNSAIKSAIIFKNTINCFNKQKQDDNISPLLFKSKVSKIWIKNQTTELRKKASLDMIFNFPNTTAILPPLHISHLTKLELKLRFCEQLQTNVKPTPWKVH